MIVSGIIICLALIGAYIFLGIKLSESIIHNDIKMFFWALYFVTLITILNISASVFFYSSLRNKKGPLGPRGKKGNMGDRGDPGTCDQEDCKPKSVQLFLEEALQEYYNENDITPLERKTICNVINKKENRENIKTWTLKDYETYQETFKTKLSLPKKPINFRIEEQEKIPKVSDLENIIIETGGTLNLGIGVNQECL
jgi:hypothetical protein